jgi:alkaline phosphatase
LTNALRYKVFSIEADVYLRDSTLLVAHTKNELATAPTLDALYLQPIIRLYSLHHGRISSDNQYAPVLMIDIKERGEAVLAQLIKQLSRYRSVFDRSLNPKAVQIVISGDRGAQPLWTTYPSYIFFDGRPYENYDSATLKRIGFISDSYANHAWPADSTAINLQRLINKVHSQDKLLRLWGISDNPASWKQLRKQGIDIINTDKVAECRKYFF